MKKEMKKGMKKIKETMENTKGMMMKALLLCFNTLLMCSAMVCRVYADTSGEFQGMEVVAKNGATQIMWVGIVIVAIAVAGLLSQRNWVAAFITLVAGVVLCVVIGHPDIMVKVGEWGITKVFNMKVG